MNCCEKQDRVKKTILIINLSPYVSKKLKKKGFNILQWNRFSSDNCLGQSWLTDKSLEGKINGCIIGLGIFKENFTMISHCLTKFLENGSFIYIYNKEYNESSSIMIHNYLIKQLGALNMFTPLKNVTPNVMKCKFNGFSLFSDNLKCNLKDWRIRTSITFDSSLLSTKSTSLHEKARTKWYTYPGLFAGGVIDIMTSYLLHTVKNEMEVTKKKKFDKILDFCCGSGTIAYAYRTLIAHENENIEMSLLDADSVAIEAAKKNIINPKNIYLSDGWAEVEEDEKFHLILSNPPVHIGHHNCFDIIYQLVEGAAKHLHSGGELWVVCQSYIPLRSLIPIKSFGYSDSIMYNDGRFSVHRFLTSGTVAVVTINNKRKINEISAVTNNRNEKRDENIKSKKKKKKKKDRT